MCVPNMKPQQLTTDGPLFLICLNREATPLGLESNLSHCHRYTSCMLACRLWTGIGAAEAVWDALNPLCTLCTHSCTLHTVHAHQIIERTKSMWYCELWDGWRHRTPERSWNFALLIVNNHFCSLLHRKLPVQITLEWFIRLNYGKWVSRVARGLVWERLRASNGAALSSLTDTLARVLQQTRGSVRSRSRSFAVVWTNNHLSSRIPLGNRKYNFWRLFHNFEWIKKQYKMKRLHTLNW